MDFYYYCYNIFNQFHCDSNRITQWCGVYEKGKIRFDKAWIYLAIFNAISQMIAIHSLIYFYKGTRKLLGPIKPVWKFLTIKAIVFAIFWSVLVYVFRCEHMCVHECVYVYVCVCVCIYV